MSQTPTRKDRASDCYYFLVACRRLLDFDKPKASLMFYESMADSTGCSELYGLDSLREEAAMLVQQREDPRNAHALTSRFKSRRTSYKMQLDKAIHEANWDYYVQLLKW
jgi:hypothetical protein